MVDKRRNNNLTLDELNAQYGKLPPQAIEVEEAVLGALMLESDAIYKVNGIIDTQSFYKDEHQKIFDVIKQLSLKNKTIDLLVVTQELKDHGVLEEIGGQAFITQLMRRVVSAAHIEFHSRIIAQKFIQRELIRVSSEVQVKAYDDTIDVDDLLNFAHVNLIAVDSSIHVESGQDSPVVAKNTLSELEEDCKKAKEGVSPGIPTGLHDLNQATGGWRDTNLIILAARPSVGKSSFALFLAKVAAEAGYWVNFYGFEMKNHDYFRILLSTETGIPRTELRDGKVEDKDWERIQEAITKLEKLPIIWYDNTELNVNHIRSNTIKNSRNGKCELVIVDYLQLVHATDKSVIREQQVSEISRTLKNTASSEDIPIIALSQLNRAIESRSDKEPNLSDLRESGAIEQDADLVLFLWDQLYPKLKIGKQRRGKIGRIDFWANNERTKFLDFPPEDVKEPQGVASETDTPF